MNADAYITLSGIDKQDHRVQADHAAAGEHVMLSWTMTREVQTTVLLHVPRSLCIRSLPLPHQRYLLSSGMLPNPMMLPQS